MPTFDDYLAKLAYYACDPEKAVGYIIAGIAAVCFFYAARALKATGKGALTLAKRPFQPAPPKPVEPVSDLCQAILDAMNGLGTEANLTYFKAGDLMVRGVLGSGLAGDLESVKVKDAEVKDELSSRERILILKRAGEHLEAIQASQRKLRLADALDVLRPKDSEDEEIIDCDVTEAWTPDGRKIPVGGSGTAQPKRVPTGMEYPSGHLATAARQLHETVGLGDLAPDCADKDALPVYVFGRVPGAGWCLRVSGGKPLAFESEEEILEFCRQHNL